MPITAKKVKTATQISQYQKARLKYGLKDLIDDAKELTKTTSPEGLTQPLDTQIKNAMKAYDDSFSELQGQLTGALDDLNPKSGLIFKSYKTTSEQYYRGLMSTINNKKDNLINKRQIAIDAIDRAFENAKSGVVDEQAKKQLEEKHQEAIKNVCDAFKKQSELLIKQNQFLIDEQKKFLRESNDPTLSQFFDLLSLQDDKGLHELTRNQRAVLLDKNSTVRDYVHKMLDETDPEKKKKLLNTSLNINSTDGSWNLGISYINPDKNIPAIDALYEYDKKTGEMRGPPSDFTFPKEDLEAYKRGFPSQFMSKLGKDYHFFNDAIFDMIRSLLVVPAIDEMNNHFALKEREMSLSKNEAVKAFMTAAAEHMPKIETPEQLKDFYDKYIEQERAKQRTNPDHKVFELPGFDIKAPGKTHGVPPEGSTQGLIDSVQSDIKEHLQKKEWAKDGPLMNLLKVHQYIYENKMKDEQALSVSGDKPFQRGKTPDTSRDNAPISISSYRQTRQ